MRVFPCRARGSRRFEIEIVYLSTWFLKLFQRTQMQNFRFLFPLLWLESKSKKLYLLKCQNNFEILSDHLQKMQQLVLNWLRRKVIRPVIKCWHHAQMLHAWKDICTATRENKWRAHATIVLRSTDWQKLRREIKPTRNFEFVTVVQAVNLFSKQKLQ